MSHLVPRVFVDESFALGEGPFWFQERFWWVDITAGALHSVDGTGGDRASRLVGRCLGAAAPIDGRLFIVALEDGFGVLDWESGAVKILASPESGIPSNRFNDGKCDPVGRFVAGTLSRSGEKFAAALYSIDGDGQWQTLHSPVTLSNGLAWTADGRTLYHVDSLAREIAAFDYNLETGATSNRRIVIDVPESFGVPDGMDIDEKGNLWVAHWGGRAVRCWSPFTGDCLEEIPVPCPAPTSCCFGGPDGSTLFITTARSGDMTPEDENMAGKIFALNMPVQGGPVRTFRCDTSASGIFHIAK